MRKNTKRLIIAVVAALLGSMMLASCVYAKVDTRQTVHTIYWNAKLRSAKAINVDGEKIKLKKGTRVLVLYRPHSRKGKCTCEKDGIRFKVPYSSLSFISDACTIKDGDYSVEVKENFVNVKHHLTSKTKYLIWASLDKQRVNVFQGSGNGGDWKLVRVSKCSSGSFESPTKIGFNMDIGFKKRVYHYSNPTFSATVQWFMEFGGSGFHKYAGSGRAKNLGKHPVSHSCVRLVKKHVKWMYKNVPVKTRVVIW